jgi:hypothetical protein
MVRIHSVNIDTHFTNNSLLCLRESASAVFLELLSTFHTLVLTFERITNSLLSFSHIICQAVLQKEPSGHGIDCFAMHLLDVLDVAANRNLVGRLDDSNPGQDAEMTHFLDSLGDSTVYRGRQSRLVAVVQLASVVDELRHERSVFPVKLFLGNAAHVPLSQLAPSKRSIDEGSGFLSFVCKHSLASANDVVSSILCLRVIKWVLVTVLLLVFPVRGGRVIVLRELVVLLGHALRGVWTKVLSKSFFDHPISGKLFVGLDQHLSNRARRTHELEKGVILEWHTDIWHL